MELWIFLGGGFALLVLLALRNGAFRPSRHGDPDGTGAHPHVTPRSAGLHIRDARAELDDGDRLGRC